MQHVVDAAGMASETPLRAPKQIRSPEFAKRLEASVDAHPDAPPLHSGRYRWLQDELAKRGASVSRESVRQWFAGGMKPRGRNMELLAEILGAPIAWVALGEEPELTPRDRKVRSAQAGGVVNIVAGLIQMSGGQVAFPEESNGEVDLTATIRGARYDFHVALGREEEGYLRFAVPTRHEDVIVLGVVMSGFSARLYELTPEVIERGTRRGGSIEVVVDAGELREIDTFARRL